MNLDIKSIALPMGNFQHLKSKLQPLISNPVGKQAFKKLSSGYKTAMDNLNNVTCKDLNEGLKISFKSHKLTEDSSVNFQHYLADMEAMNIVKITDTLLEDFCTSFPKKSHPKIKDTFLSWRSKSLATWDDHLENLILLSMDKKHKEKCSLEFGIYNFTDNIIKKEDYELLKNGKKMVVPLHQG